VRSKAEQSPRIVEFGEERRGKRRNGGWVVLTVSKTDRGSVSPLFSSWSLESTSRFLRGVASPHP
jgi:hypothetical protein